MPPVTFLPELARAALLDALVFIQSLIHYNSAYLQEDLIDKSSFDYLCKYDHCAFVEFLLKKDSIDVNNLTKKFFFTNLKF